MTFSASLRASRATIVIMVIIGMVWGALAGLVPDIKAITGVSDAGLGSAMMFSAAGSMTAMYFAPRYFQYMQRRALPVAGLFVVAAFFYPALAFNFISLGIALYFLGASMGMCDINTNMRISVIENTHDASLMNLNHAMFSFGFGFTALAVGVARQSGFGPSEILPALALIALVMLPFSIEKAADWRNPADEPDDSGETATGGTFWRVVGLTALVLFAGFVGENSTEAWSALHIERTLGAEAGHGSYGPGVLGLVMGVGRLFGQSAANRLGEIRLIMWSAFLGVVGALLIAVAWSPNAVLFGVAIVAIGMAVVVPSANTVLGQRLRPSQVGLALSRAWMFGMTGFFLGPAIMGGVSELTDLRTAYAVMALIVALIIPAILALGRVPLRNPT